LHHTTLTRRDSFESTNSRLLLIETAITSPNDFPPGKYIEWADTNQLEVSFTDFKRLKGKPMPETTVTHQIPKYLRWLKQSSNRFAEINLFWEKTLTAQEILQT
jgi:hypothetical protein